MQISMETARDIAIAHQEIETAQKLLADVKEAMSRQSVPDLRDGFGRLRGLQLGVPSGDNGHRLFNVPWSLAQPIIETHIATQRAKVSVLSAKAIAEASFADNVAPETPEAA